MLPVLQLGCGNHLMMCEIIGVKIIDGVQHLIPIYAQKNMQNGRKQYNARLIG
jgi:hypothetical protein